MWCVHRPCRRLFFAAMAGCIAAAWHGPTALAEGWDDIDGWGLHFDRGPTTPHFELWAGAQALAHAWSVYSGLTAAPFSSIQHDGVRLRVVTGYGAYAYSGSRAAGVGSKTVTFKGEAPFADLLVGYHTQLGPLTLKAFAGVALAEYRMVPDDPETAIRGAGAGGKLALETWWTLSDRAWSSVDVSWVSLHASYAARARLGWRLSPVLSAGLEAGAAGNEECDIVRAAGFLRYEWAGGEVSASGGLSNDKLLRGSEGADLERSSEPFVTLSWLTRF